MNDFGGILQTARRAQGLTEAQLAEQAQVSQAAINRYENGTRTPESGVVARLAAALGVTESFLNESGRIHQATAVDAHMRRRQTARPTIWRALEARLNMYRLHVRHLMEEVSMRTEQIVPRFDSFDTDPAAAARLVRAQWRMPIGPVRSLTQWAEAAGCVIIEEDFATPRVDGLSQWIEDYPVMLLNLRAPTDRKRLTIAHELGHLCLHDVVNEHMEEEANAFAAEFLMPETVIKPQLRNLTIGRLPDLKRQWGVSMQALIERAHNLDMVSATQRTSMYKTLSARGWRTREPISDELQPEHVELPQYIGQSLASKGLSADEISHLAGYDCREDHPFRPVASGRLRAI